MNTSIDKSSLLAEIQFILYPKFYPKPEANAQNVPTQSSENQYDRMLALLAEVLEENEDLLYGLFWDEYGVWLAQSASEQWNNSKWFIHIFAGIVQKPTPRAVRFAGGLLLDPHYPVRDFVAEGLGRMGSVDAYPYLLAVAHHEDFQIATRAIRALGEVKAVQAESFLIALLTGSDQTDTPDDKDIIQAYALDGLVLLDTATGWETIESVAVQRSFDERLRRDAIKCLAEKKGMEAIPLLQRLASDESVVVQDTITYYLGKFKEPSIPKQGKIWLVDAQERMLALIEIESMKGDVYCGQIIKNSFPTEIQAIFNEFDEIVDGQIFSLLDEIEAKINSLDLRIVERLGYTHIRLNDLQIYKDGGISFRVLTPISS